MLTEKQKKRLGTLAKVIDNGNPAILERIDEVEDTITERIDGLEKQIPDVKKALDRVEALVDGEKGEKGDKGDKGEKGDRGPEGKQGKRGERGERRYQPQVDDGKYNLVAVLDRKIYSELKKKGYQLAEYTNPEELGFYGEKGSKQYQV